MKIVELERRYHRERNKIQIDFTLRYVCGNISRGFSSKFIKNTLLINYYVQTCFCVLSYERYYVIV